MVYGVRLSQDLANQHLTNVEKGGLHDLPPHLGSYWHLMASGGEKVNFL